MMQPPHTKPLPPKRNRGLASRLWQFFASPSAHYSLGAIMIYGFGAGIIFWGAFHWAVELSNTDTFCLSCHEHKEFVYPEYKTSKHFVNESGVRAICTDCHVPNEWAYKIGRKIYVLNELYYHLLGSLKTKEKFEAKRLTMASRVWDSLEKSDSRECRNCHDYSSMNTKIQDGVAARQHQLAAERGVTCISCHKGIAHTLPTGTPERKLLVDLK